MPRTIRYFLCLFILFPIYKGFTQGEQYHIIKNQPINFNGILGDDTDIIRLQSGRVIIKKVTVPDYPSGTDVKIKLTLRSNGDRWDKSGSCFVLTEPELNSIMKVSKEESKFSANSSLGEKFGGIKASEDYVPPLEILRFMTPFGVGHYSDNLDSNRRPVYIPKWEKQVVWESDISQLSSVVTGSFYLGIWIDSWTEEGYAVDVSLTYSNRPLAKRKVLPLVNTVPYVNGQSLPDFFAIQDLKQLFSLKKEAKNTRLHYITTGHGGHSGGDEFIKIKNSLYMDNQLVLDSIPWRDDCASFRRFNPTSGVWLKKDSASYIDFEAKKYRTKEIEERIASSDLSRSNWCPGSKVEPMIVDLGNLKSGDHELIIKIPATKADKDKLNHWLVSAYLTYEE